MIRTSGARLQPVPSVRYREATEHDAGAIAVLHADSWRLHYRGAYLDAYLDGDIVMDRLKVWTTRLTPPRLNQYTVLRRRRRRRHRFCSHRVRPRSDLGSPSRQSACTGRRKGNRDRHTIAF